MAGVVLSVLVLAAAAGCGGDRVHVDGFHVPAADRIPCQKLLSALPGTLADQPRRDVSGSEYAAAWGDPAIVLRCGVPLPKGFAGDPCITRNGIGWSIPQRQTDDTSADVVMTVAFHTPVVQVELPADYRPNGPMGVMADLDPVVRANTTTHGHCT